MEVIPWTVPNTSSFRRNLKQQKYRFRRSFQYSKNSQLYSFPKWTTRKLCQQTKQQNIFWKFAISGFWRLKTKPINLFPAQQSMFCRKLLYMSFGIAFQNHGNSKRGFQSIKSKINPTSCLLLLNEMSQLKKTIVFHEMCAYTSD